MNPKTRALGAHQGNPIVLVLAEMIELIFLSVAVVVWIYYTQNVSNTDVFNCCYEIKDFFQSPIFS